MAAGDALGRGIRPLRGRAGSKRLAGRLCADPRRPKQVPGFYCAGAGRVEPAAPLPRQDPAEAALRKMVLWLLPQGCGAFHQEPVRFLRDHSDRRTTYKMRKTRLIEGAKETLISRVFWLYKLRQAERKFCAASGSIEKSKFSTTDSSAFPSYCVTPREFLPAQCFMIRVPDKS